VHVARQAFAFEQQRALALDFDQPLLVLAQVDRQVFGRVPLAHAGASGGLQAQPVEGDHRHEGREPRAGIEGILVTHQRRGAEHAERQRCAEQHARRAG